MIKAVLFDLDGVLADTASLHDEALNAALKSVDPSFHIPEDEFKLEYGTLTSREKLHKFFTSQGVLFDDTAIEAIYALKQEYVSKTDLRKYLTPEKTREMIIDLRGRGYKVGICSNAGHGFVAQVVRALGLQFGLDVCITNASAKRPKPNPDIYMQAMLELGVGSRETLVIEDSHHGVEAAYAAGCHVAIVASPKEVTSKLVDAEIAYADSAFNAPAIHAPKLTIVVPMAGAGSRFEKAGYKDHKPMIPVGTDTILGLTLKSLAHVDAKYVFIVQRQHYQQYDLGTRLRLLKPGCEIVQIDGLTEGAASTLLLAKKHYDNGDPMMIINSDNLILWDRKHLLHMLSSGVDGGIVVFRDSSPKWSFAKNGPDGFVTEVAEKKPISDLATAGVYFWRKGSDFVKYARQMIEKNIRVNNEFYTCPVYNEAIADGRKIKTYDCSKMYGLGTPEDLEVFKDIFPEYRRS